MTPDSLTQRIYNKSDRELWVQVAESLKWVWEEGGRHDSCRPDLSDLNEDCKRRGINSFTAPPWIGEEINRMEIVAFHYLRDIRRKKALTEFMQNVERVKNALDSEPQ